MLQCVINVKDNRLYFDGDVPVEEIRNITSWLVQGHQFSQAYKKGHWDGRKHLFDKKTNSCPTGLLALVLEHLLAVRPGLRITVQEAPQAVFPVGGRVEVRGKLKGLFGLGIFDYQMEAALAAIDKKRGIIKIATNGGKFSIAAAIINYLHLPTLFVVPGIELLYQSVENFSDLLEIDKNFIGVMGDGHFSVGEWITVATADTLHSRLFGKTVPKELTKIRWECLIVDECHGSGSDTWYEIMDVIPATWRIGTSGTPLNRSDGNTLRLIAQTGPIIYEVANKTLVERGISVQPLVKLISINEPKIPKKRNKVKVTYAEAYDEGVTNNFILNQKVVEELMALLMKNKKVIIMIDRIEHGENLLNMYEELRKNTNKFTPKIEFMHGTLDSESRTKILNDFKGMTGTRGIIATSILNQGVDMNCIDALILAGGGRAVIPLLQRIGRGLRTGPNKDKLLIIDFMNSCHAFLAKHATIRLQTYQQQDCFEFIK